MLKNVVELEYKVAEKTGRFILDNDTPTAAAKEMCLAFLKIIGQIEDAAKAQQDAAKSEPEEVANNPEN